MNVEIKQISAADVRPLRHKVLRPHQPPEELVYNKDDHPQSFHLGAFVDGAMIGIASFLYDDHPDIPDPGLQYRIRGMATLPELQGQGNGRALVVEGLQIIRDRSILAPEKKTLRVWCNARESAFGFYEKLGFVTVGEMFDIPGIGPHKVMWRAL